ncbi:MAG TPA: cation-transporting P-type ATPase, partial [Verrucomicrobium sp.]|nr:cation-transporting P-type ATPase [Verrucomicrobium sp.]
MMSPLPLKPAVAEAPWHQSVEAVLATQQTDRHRGLSDAEAQTRLDLHGRNELTSKKPAPAWRTFLAQFESGLVMVLLAATAISAGL